MLKIWLSWLQPSLGVFGTALVLSIPLCSTAAPNLSAANQNRKVPAQSPQWSSLKPTGTGIEKALLKGIAATPDEAVRQLAISTMASSNAQASVATISKPQDFSPLANLIGTPAKLPQLSAKVNKPQPMKESFAAALTKTIKPQAGVVVPGLAIGTGNVQLSAKLVATVKPAVRMVAATAPVVAPVQLSAMITDRVASPFPVVNPELMQKLEVNSVVASAKNTKNVTLDVSSLQAISTGLPKAINTASLNPTASIPAGLQQLLGNNFDAGTKVIVTPVAKATGPNFRSMAALTKLVSPAELVAPASVTKTSFQLATAQAYSAPKFSIPGETIVAATPATPVENVMTQRDATAVSTAGKDSNYVALVSNRGLTPAPRQSWTAVGQNSSLGGLILGSQQLATLPKVVSFVPLNNTKNSNFTGVTVSDLGNIN